MPSLADSAVAVAPGRPDRRRRLLGMPLDALTVDQAVERILAGLERGESGTVLTPNVDIVRQYWRSPELRQLFERIDVVVADGMPVVWAARIQGTPVPERITGTDILWSLTAAAAGSGASVFLAGGPPGTAARAADRLVRTYPALRATARACYVDVSQPLAAQTGDLVDALVAAKPDIVYLGLPFAAQVQLMTVLGGQLPQAWLVGVGSSFSFVNGDRARAPKWLQRLGLEWAFRLVHEPQLWRRYLVQGLPFAAYLGLHAVSRRARAVTSAKPDGGEDNP